MRRRIRDLEQRIEFDEAKTKGSLERLEGVASVHREQLRGLHDLVYGFMMHGGFDESPTTPHRNPGSSVFLFGGLDARRRSQSSDGRPGIP